MIRLLKILLLVAVVGAVAAIAVSRRGHAATPETMPAMNMSAAEHLEHIKTMAASGDIHANHALDEFARGAAQASPSNAKLPADDMGVVARLASSPRKGEYVNVMVDGKPMRTWVVRPAGNGKAPVVVVIMEIFGLSDWIRGVADQLAKEGFIAIAPDFLSGMGPNHGGSQELGEQGSTQPTMAMKDEDKLRILNDVRAYAMKIPSANGKLATVGFCWGGGTSFLYALNEPSLAAAVSYYGPMPDSLDYSKAKAPILGLYGENDPRVDAGIPRAKEELAKRNVTYEPHVFPGAGHGFLRQQGGNQNAPGNKAAAEQAWPLTLEFLRKYTK